MSLEAAKKFVESLKHDDDLLNQVTGCTNANERMALVKEKGFDFSVEELEKARSEFTDDDLLGTLNMESNLGFDGPAGHGWREPER